MEAPFLKLGRILPTIHLGVIDDGRRRQRRRRLGSLAVLIAALVAAAVVAERPAGEQSARQPEAASRPLKLVAPSVVLSRSPYMGVACRTPNWTACDRIGLAVWLKRPAVAMTAVIGGRRLPLDSLDLWERQWILARHGQRRTMFSGYLSRAGLRSKYHIPSRWMGNPTPQPLVRLRIDDGRGGLFETRVRVDLMAGWG